MKLKFVILFVLSIIIVLSDNALAAETTTEVYCTNYTTENVIMRVSRDQIISSIQNVTVPKNGGMEIIYDYPTAYYLTQKQYKYKVSFFNEDESRFDCMIRFSIDNAYILWPTIMDAKIEEKTGSNCEFLLDIGLLIYGVGLYVELK